MDNKYNFYGNEFKGIERKKPGNEKLRTLGSLYVVLRK